MRASISGCPSAPACWSRSRRHSARVIPSGPAGLGVFEAATVVALSAYGVSGTEALTYAVVLHARNFFPFLLAGGIALLLSTRPA